MRESNWMEVLFNEGTDGITSLIAKHNAGIEPLNVKQSLMLRDKLRNLGISGTIEYVKRKYGGVLLEPDTMGKVPCGEWRKVPHVPLKPAPIFQRRSTNLADEAETVFLGKSYVVNVFRIDDGMLVLVDNDNDAKRVERCVKASYSKLNIRAVVRDGN